MKVLTFRGWGVALTLNRSAAKKKKTRRWQYVCCAKKLFVSCFLCFYFHLWLVQVFPILHFQRFCFSRAKKNCLATGTCRATVSQSGTLESQSGTEGDSHTETTWSQEINIESYESKLSRQEKKKTKQNNNFVVVFRPPPMLSKFPRRQTNLKLQG